MKAALAWSGLAATGVLSIIGVGMQYGKLDTLIAEGSDERSVEYYVVASLLQWVLFFASAVAYQREMRGLGGGLVLAATAVLGFVNMDFPSIARTNFHRILIQDNTFSGSFEEAVKITFAGETLVLLSGWTALVCVLYLSQIKDNDWAHMMGFRISIAALVCLCMPYITQYVLVLAVRCSLMADCVCHWRNNSSQLEQHRPDY